MEVTAERNLIMEELNAGTQCWRGPGSKEDFPRASAPMMIMMIAVELDSQSRELLPWFLDGWNQGVTRRCRLPLLTNSALIYRVQMRGEWGIVGSHPMSAAVHIT
jgi:hypothetical protein